MRLPTLSELIIPQSKNIFCEQFWELVRLAGSAFTFDKYEIVIRKAYIDESIQTPLPTSLRARLLQQTHHSIWEGHPEERRIYDSLRRDYNYPHIVKDVHKTALNSSQWPRMGTKLKHQGQLKLLPPVGSLKFLAIDLLWPLPRSKTGNQLVVIMTDRYSKLLRAILTTKITSTQVVHILFYGWVLPYEILDVILSKNCQ